MNSSQFVHIYGHCGTQLAFASQKKTVSGILQFGLLLAGYILLELLFVHSFALKIIRNGRQSESDQTRVNSVIAE